METRVEKQPKNRQPRVLWKLWTACMPMHFHLENELAATNNHKVDN